MLSRLGSSRPWGVARLRVADPVLGSRCVNDDVEALAGSRRDEITRKQIVLSFAYLEGVLATRISFSKPLLADRVRNIE